MTWLALRSCCDTVPRGLGDLQGALPWVSCMESIDEGRVPIPQMPTRILGPMKQETCQGQLWFAKFGLHFSGVLGSLWKVPESPRKSGESPLLRQHNDISSKRSWPKPDPNNILLGFITEMFIYIYSLYIYISMDQSHIIGIKQIISKQPTTRTPGTHLCQVAMARPWRICSRVNSHGHHGSVMPADSQRILNE